MRETPVHETEVEYRTLPGPTEEDVKNNRRQVRIASGANLLLGLWLIASPWLFDVDAGAATWNFILVGAAVAILAGIRAFGAYRTTWPSWLNAALGVWLVVSPWLLWMGEDAGNSTWNAIIVGVLVAAFGIWSALATRNTVLKYHNEPAR